MDSVLAKLLSTTYWRYYWSTDGVLSTLEGQSYVTKGHDNFEVTNRSCDTCFVVNFGQGIRLYCVHKVVWSNFQQFIVTFRSRSGRKRSNFQFNKCQQKVYQMKRKSDSAHLSCYATSETCLNMHLNYKHYHMVYLDSYIPIEEQNVV